MSGLKLAAIYGFPPLRLGFCGPGGDKNLKILLEFIAGDDSLAEKTKEILSHFKSAFSYYRLIARVNGNVDPFDQRVVEAYWLGNRLLDKVHPSDLKQLILTDFCQPGLLNPKKAKTKAAAIPPDAKPHHSFHVLIIGSVTGRVKFTTKVRDVCRVGWGEVIKLKIKNEKLKIKYKPLRNKEGKFYLARPMERVIDWNPVFVPRVKIGDTVSFHWNRACQVLKEEEVKNLEKYTRLNIRAVNESLCSSSIPGDGIPV